MEVILSTAFGVQRDVQTDQDEPYTPNAALLFRQPAVSISLSKYSNDSRCRAVLTDYSDSHVSHVCMWAYDIDLIHHRQFLMPNSLIRDW